MSLKNRIKQITPTQVVTTAAVVTLGVVGGASIYYTKLRSDAFANTCTQSIDLYAKYLADALEKNLPVTNA